LKGGVPRKGDHALLDGECCIIKFHDISFVVIIYCNTSSKGYEIVIARPVKLGSDVRLQREEKNTYISKLSIGDPEAVFNRARSPAGQRSNLIKKKLIRIAFPLSPLLPIGLL
jgi:hypothetical protein